MVQSSTVEGRPAGGLVFSGTSVDEAIDTGLAELGLTREAAQIEILDQGSRGFLGLGSRPARVRIGTAHDLATIVRAVALELLEKMGIDAEMRVRQTGREVLVEIDPFDGDGLLIGRRGETLEALQHLVQRLSGRRAGADLERVRMDVAGYRKRREEQLVSRTRALADRVAQTGRRSQTEPLSPAERRIVHRVLEDDDRVRTHTSGSGPQQRVVITPPGQRPRRRR